MTRVDKLWEEFCHLRSQSSAYRAVDDPKVAGAHRNWLRAFLEEEQPRAVVIPFPKPKGARHDR